MDASLLRYFHLKLFAPIVGTDSREIKADVGDSDFVLLFLLFLINPNGFK